MPQAATQSPFANGTPILVAELPQSAPPGDPRGFSQANFTKVLFEGFFGASVDGDSIYIDLYHVGPEGELGDHEHRKSVRATVSGNWRFELNAAKGRDYPDIRRGRPIGVFVRLTPTTFLYRLLMPVDAEHGPADQLLAARQAPYVPKKGTRMRSAEVATNDLLPIWPTNPVWLVAPAAVAALVAGATPQSP